MGGSDIEVPAAPYVYGGDNTQLCRECQLPCQLKVTSTDCFRRFFLQGMLECTYFVFGYCFLTTEPGCVFDNGGHHEDYWLNLLNDYFHNVGNRDTTDPDFVSNSEQLKKLVAQQVEDRQVQLCRYFEEYYNRVMEQGGGLSEEIMGKLDEAFLSLLAGTTRKR
jgi:hypothetical protein